MSITVVICTYNRANILQKCLQSLTNQTIKDFSVLIVDNCSTDSTAKVISDFSYQFTDFQSVYEPKLGLSHARNHAYKIVKTDWLIYLDDDAIAFPNWIEQAFFTIQNFDFQCFGGIYHAKYETPKPKWFRSDWCTNYNEITEIEELPPHLFASGCVIAIQRKVLEELNGFRTDIGLIGKQLILGEETNLQVRMRQKNMKIGFNPHFEIQHLVFQSQFSVKWFVKRWYATGYSFYRTFGYSGLPENSFKFVWRFMLAFKNGVIKVVNLRKKDYFIQNFLIDFLSPLAYEIGLWKGRKL